MASSQTASLPGKNGQTAQVLLPNGWSLSPAGKQVDLGGMPLRVVAVPHSRYAVVTSNGFGPQFLALLDCAINKVVERVPVAQAWMGLAVSPDGHRVYASAGAEDRILVYQFENGHLKPDGDIPLPSHTYPAGIAVSGDQKRLYVAGNLSNTVLALEAQARKIAFQSPTESKPYMCALSKTTGRLYVSNWGRKTISVLNSNTGRPVTTIQLEGRPNDLLATPDGTLIFAADSDRNIVSIIDARTNTVKEEIETSLTQDSLPGSTPNALALDTVRHYLYVANADNNSVAVVDVSRPGQSKLRGFLPTAWYPTGLTLVNDKIVVINGKGDRSRSNASEWGGGQGKATAPGSVSPEDRNNRGYIGNILQGTVSFVDKPDEHQLSEYTRQVQRNSPYANRPLSLESPIALGKTSPIRHVIYIIKENRTYDQVFGDMPQGNGDPRYCLFPESVTPNHHALARQFVLIDNLFHNAEVSASGHFWVNSAYDRDYVEKLWPSTYSGRGKKERLEYHDDPEAYPAHGFLWDLCARFGLSYRSYGEFARVAGAPDGQVKAATPSLIGHVNPSYRGADFVAGMGDLQRYEIWLKEFREFERTGKMPQFVVISLPGDHTLGTRPGKQTPRAMLAENDLALGKMIDAITHSTFWKDTAVFVIEDDAQNGPDHVDCHRTVALLLSPYVRHGYVDHTMYSAVSLLKTMELILGLPAMSQYDEAATPMWPLFQHNANNTPFTARPSQISLDEKNTMLSYGAKESLKMDLDEADDADEDELTAIVWKSVRGAASVVPPRRIAASVSVHN